MGTPCPSLDLSVLNKPELEYLQGWGSHLPMQSYDYNNVMLVFLPALGGLGSFSEPGSLGAGDAGSINVAGCERGYQDRDPDLDQCYKVALYQKQHSPGGLWSCEHPSVPCLVDFTV